MGLKENLKEKRQSLDLTLEEAAKIIGISRSTLHKYESGTISNIPQDKIEKLAKLYSITPSELMGWVDTEITEDDITNFLNKHGWSKEDYNLFNTKNHLLDKSLELLGYKISYTTNGYLELKYKSQVYKLTIEQYEKLKYSIESYIDYSMQSLITSLETVN